MRGYEDVYFDYLYKGKTFYFKELESAAKLKLEPIEQIQEDVCGTAVYQFEFLTEDVSSEIFMAGNNLVVSKSYKRPLTVMKWSILNDYV